MSDELTIEMCEEAGKLLGKGQTEQPARFWFHDVDTGELLDSADPKNIEAMGKALDDMV